MTELPKFILVDGHALIYRAYHAYPPLTSPMGQLVNAVYGFTRILLTVIRQFEPEYLAVAFDHPQPTFRHTDFAQYKANRPEMPVDLQPQIELIKQVVAALSIPQFEQAGYEADDLIGSICQLLKSKRLLTLVVTGDKDLLQLVNDRVHVFIPSRGKYSQDVEYDPAQVQVKMGVTPRQIPDLKALMGDASDNIPGVMGVGAKTATKLINAFRSLANLYQYLGQKLLTDAPANPSPLDQSPLATILTQKLRDKLSSGRDLAELSRQLATIDTQVVVDFDLSKCRVQDYDKEKVWQLFGQLDFKSLIPLLPTDDFEAGVQSALF